MYAKIIFFKNYTKSLLLQKESPLNFPSGKGLKGVSSKLPFRERIEGSKL